MNYHQRIQNMLSDSGYNLKEVAKHCEEKGLSITPSYLSKLKNGQQKPASDEVHFVLAEICGVDPYELLFEAHYEKSPPWLKEIWDGLTERLKDIYVSSLQKVPTEVKEWAQKSIEEAPLYDCVQKFISQKDGITQVSALEGKIEVIFEGEQMIPFLYPGDQLWLDTKAILKNGDMACASLLDESLKVGRYVKEEGKILLIPQDSKHEIVILSTEKVAWIYKIETFMRRL